MLKNSSWSLIKKLIHCPIHHLQLVLLKALKVHTTDQFFIVTRRGASLDRRLALWKRELLKSSPTKKLTLHCSGKKGMDDAAINMELLEYLTLKVLSFQLALLVIRCWMCTTTNSFHVVK